MAVEMRQYGLLNDQQKTTLRSFYDDGMNMTGKEMNEKIMKAAEESDVTMERVKKWIGNETRRRKRKLAMTREPEELMEDAPINMGPPIKRSTSGYNIFSSKLLSSDECKSIESKSEKMSFVASQWRSLNDTERSMWKTEANKIKRTCGSLLPVEEKRKQIIKCRKNLVKELSYLESLGCETSVLMMEPETGTVNQYGSSKGVKFLLENDTIPLKFMQFFDTPKVDAITCSYTSKDVKELYNRKFSEASGKPGSCVPYLKGGFTVTGLPSGVVFKKPNSYGNDKVNKIMQCQEKIVFNLTEVSVDSGDDSTNANTTDAPVPGDQSRNGTTIANTDAGDQSKHTTTADTTDYGDQSSNGTTAETTDSADKSSSGTTDDTTAESGDRCKHGSVTHERTEYGHQSGHGTCTTTVTADAQSRNGKTSQELYRVLCKVVDQAKAVQVVTEGAVIEECDIEVIDFVLHDKDYELLFNKYRSHFTNDAIVSLRANYETSCKHEGSILPVYTESEETYWLFYFPGGLSVLDDIMQTDKQISGYWLNMTKEALTYELLLSKKKVSIKPISIVTTSEECKNTYLFLKKAILLKKKNKVTLPVSFHDSILACLEKHGFV